jgi:hypothetical protein
MDNNQQYDAWGQPLPQQDTHRAYPATHSDTLVPAVHNAIQGSKKPKIPQFKGLGKQIIIAGGILGGFWIFSNLITLSSRQAVSSPQLELEPAPVEAVEETTPEPPPLSDLTSRRSEAWREVQQVCGVDLIAAADVTDTEVSIARKDSWQLHSKQQCDKDPNCKSPYSWLQQQLDHRGALIQQNAPADRLSTKAQEVVTHRQAQADLKDIARALASGVSPRALSWVPADRLSDAIDTCSDAARRFESLTRATIEEATALPGGDVDDAF